MAGYQETASQYSLKEPATGVHLPEATATRAIFFTKETTTKETTTKETTIHEVFFAQPPAETSNKSVTIESDGQTVSLNRYNSTHEKAGTIQNNWKKLYECKDDEGIKKLLINLTGIYGKRLYSKIEQKRIELSSKGEIRDLREMIKAEVEARIATRKEKNSENNKTSIKNRKNAAMTISTFDNNTPVEELKKALKRTRAGRTILKTKKEITLKNTKASVEGYMENSRRINKACKERKRNICTNLNNICKKLNNPHYVPPSIAEVFKGSEQYLDNLSKKLKRDNIEVTLETLTALINTKNTKNAEAETKRPKLSVEKTTEDTEQVPIFASKQGDNEEQIGDFASRDDNQTIEELITKGWQGDKMTGQEGSVSKDNNPGTEGKNTLYKLGHAGGFSVNELLNPESQSGPSTVYKIDVYKNN